jgi:hypothetical protein
MNTNNTTIPVVVTSWTPIKTPESLSKLYWLWYARDWYNFLEKIPNEPKDFMAEQRSLWRKLAQVVLAMNRFHKSDATIFAKTPTEDDIAFASRIRLISITLEQRLLDCLNNYKLGRDDGISARKMEPRVMSSYKMLQTMKNNNQLGRLPTPINFKDDIWPNVFLTQFQAF